MMGVVKMTSISTTSTLVAAPTPVVVGESGARTCDQERGSGHNGQNQRLTKHQRSPHLVEHLRRVHSEKLHTPWLLTLPDSVENALGNKSVRSRLCDSLWNRKENALIGWKTA